MFIMSFPVLFTALMTECQMLVVTHTSCVLYLQSIRLLDVHMGSFLPAGRLVFELFADITPKVSKLLTEAEKAHTLSSADC